MSSASLRQLIAYDESLSGRIAEFGADGLPRALAWLIARTGDSIFWLVISVVLIWWYVG